MSHCDPEKFRGYISRHENIPVNPCTDFPQGARKRFVESMADYMQALLCQVEFEHSTQVPDVEQYLAMRRGGIAATPCFALFEYALPLGWSHKSMSLKVLAADTLISWIYQTKSSKILGFENFKT